MQRNAEPSAIFFQILNSLIGSLTGSSSLYFQAWAQFCCIMWRGQLGVTPYSHRVDAEVTFYIYRFPILFVELFWEQH